MESQSQPTQQPMSTNFQSIDDFVREQEALDAVKSAQMKSRAQALLSNTKTKPKSKIKRVQVDVEAVAAEARAVAELGDTNWAGRLLEYRMAHPIQVAGVRVKNSSEGLSYVEMSTGSVAKFRYTVKIDERPEPFSDSNVFTKKKEAKHHASKKAIEWLIDNKFMPADGSVRFPKPILTPPASGMIGPQYSGSSASPKGPKGQSSASQVAPLCLKLGFGMPKYVIERISEAAPLYKGYATFQGDPRIEEDKIGEVADIYGQKTAKEKIAEVVLAFLKDIERQRAEIIDDDNKKRKRSLQESPIKTKSTEKLAKLDV